MQNLKTTPRGWIVGLSGALLVAAALKIGLLFAEVVPFNADEAVVALMARHILQGERPVFFYGQAYMGSLDAYLIAAIFKLVGYQVWGIRFVQTLLYLLTIITTAILGKRLTGKWQIGVLAAWFLAVPNISTTLYTTVSMGGYGEMLLIGNLILLTTLRIANNLSANQKKRQIIAWFGLGFLSGFGLWVFGLTLVYSLPAFAYLGWYCFRAKKLSQGRNNTIPERINAGMMPPNSEKLEPDYQLKTWGAALIGGVFGALPWWAYARQAGLSNLLIELSGGAISGVESFTLIEQLGRHLLNLSLFGSTVMLGFRPPWEIRWLALPLAPLVMIFWGAVLVFAYKKFLQDTRINPRDDGFSHSPLLGGVVLMVLVGFLVSPFGADPSGRYFLPVGIVMALFGAQAIWKWQSRWGAYIWSLAGLVLVFHIWGTVQVAHSFPPGVTTQFDVVTQVDHRYDQELVEFLHMKAEDRGYTNYWVAYPLAFLSNEALVYVPGLPYHQDLRYTSRDNRYQPYDQMVDQSESLAYITTNNPQLDGQLRTGFTRLGVSWEEAVIGDYQVFFHLSQRVSPVQLGLGGSGR